MKLTTFTLFTISGYKKPERFFCLEIFGFSFNLKGTKRLLVKEPMLLSIYNDERFLKVMVLFVTVYKRDMGKSVCDICKQPLTDEEIKTGHCFNCGEQAI